MAKPTEASKPLEIDLTSLPMRIRYALWMAFGAALGLPVDALFKMVSLQIAAAKRQLKGKRLRMTLAERLDFTKPTTLPSGTFKESFDRIISPDTFIRWIKRYQERQANAAKKPKKKGRPWISLKKVDAILRIYDAGHIGLKRIVGGLLKSFRRAA